MSDVPLRDARAHLDLVFDREQRRRLQARALQLAIVPRHQGMHLTTEVVLPIRGTCRVERNAPCPCGSGKKAKKCCARSKQLSAVSDQPEAGVAP